MSMAPSSVVVIDSHSGNLRSVLSALARAGVEPKVAASANDVAAAKYIIMPGQAQFGDVMQSLRQRKLDQSILESIERGVPYIGFCVGMQILFEASDEAPGVSGLGIIKGSVKRFNGSTNDKSWRIPHMGWNTLASQHALIAPDSWVYFAHSYYCEPEDVGVAAARTKYAGENFCSAVVKGNVFACQFHPEKSQKTGLRLLQRLLGGQP